MVNSVSLCLTVRDDEFVLRLQTYLWSMRVPDTLSCSFCLILEVLLFVVFFASLAFDLFQLCPAIFQEFRGQINSPDLGISKVAWNIVIARQGVY